MFSALRSVARSTQTSGRALLPNQSALWGGAQQQQQPHQLRNYWQIVLTKRPDRETGKPVFDEWTYLIKGMQDPKLADGTSLLQRDRRNRRHIKPFMKKKIATEKKEWNRKCRNADALLKYVQYMREHGAYRK